MRSFARTIPPSSSPSWRRSHREGAARGTAPPAAGRRRPGSPSTSTRVVATDASARQIASARSHPRVEYSVAPAEASGLPDRSVELVTVAQAVHWFDRQEFWAEVSRVLVPGGVLAVWCYHLFHLDEPVDRVIRRLYGEIVGPDWPPERKIVERGYRFLGFPVRRGRGSAVSDGQAVDVRPDGGVPADLVRGPRVSPAGRGRPRGHRGGRSRTGLGRPGTPPAARLGPGPARREGPLAERLESTGWRSPTPSGGRCATSGSRSRTGATFAASTACRRRTTPGCLDATSSTSKRSRSSRTSSRRSGSSACG